MQVLPERDSMYISFCMLLLSKRLSVCKFNIVNCRFGPYFCQPVIAGLGDNDEPFICTMDCLGAKYVMFILNLPKLFSSSRHG
jgi:20S proteasome alpha/beta subunit